MKKPTKQNIGNIGEYYIASVLSARNCVVNITLGRAELVDLFILNPKNHLVKIQVKTAYNSVDFPFSKKSDNIDNVHEDLFYIFICYKPEDLFEYWVLSSKELFKYSTYIANKYYSDKNRDGSERKDIGLRKIYFSSQEKLKAFKRTYEPLYWEEKKKECYKNLDKILEF